MNVLITGGASGLGEAITRKLAENLKNIIYFTYNHSVESALRLEKDFPNARSLQCDFKSKESVDELKGKLSGFNLDVLINNAYSGTFMKSHFHKIPVYDFEKEFRENIVPTIILTQEAISCFRKKKQGKIITILTSALLNVPPAGSAIYIANKAYLQKLTKIWASENIKFNITSNSVSPSFMSTNFTKGIDERLVEQIIVEHPLKKVLTVEEVADAVIFLTSATTQISGVDLVINAGSALR